MILLDYVIPLIGTYWSSGMFELWFAPALILGVIYLVPSLIRSCFFWR